MRADVEDRPVLLTPRRSGVLAAEQPAGEPARVPALHGPPAATSASHSLVSGAKRNVRTTRLATPAAQTASASRRASSSEAAIGFSRMR